MKALLPATSQIAEMPRTADAFLNFGDRPYPAAESLTTGDASVWYQSPVVTDLYDGQTPTAPDRSAFSQNVMAQVEETFLDSGLDVALTLDPKDDAAHTISLVSGARASNSPNAIGIAEIGGDGFTFLDNFEAVDSVDQLETAVANNIAHELMHTFGADHHHDSTEFIDSGQLPWDVLVDSEAQFSASAVAELAALDFQERWDDQVIGLQSASDHDHDHAHQSGQTLATPEPTTWVVWSALAAVGLVWAKRRDRRAKAE